MSARGLGRAFFAGAITFAALYGGWLAYQAFSMAVSTWKVAGTP